LPRNEYAQVAGGARVYEDSSERTGLLANTAQIGNVPGSDADVTRVTRIAAYCDISAVRCRARKRSSYHLTDLIASKAVVCPSIP